MVLLEEGHTHVNNYNKISFSFTLQEDLANTCWTERVMQFVDIRAKFALWWLFSLFQFSEGRKLIRK